MIQSCRSQIERMQCEDMSTYGCQWNKMAFIYDATADRRSQMNSEMFWALLSAHIQTNTAKLTWMDNDPKYSVKATQDFKGKEMELFSTATSAA